MPSPEFLTRGIILGSEPSGEKFVNHSLFTTDQGIVNLLARRSNKPGRRVAIDLFDEGEFRFEKPDSRSAFLKETQSFANTLKLPVANLPDRRPIRSPHTSQSDSIENQEQVYGLLKRGLKHGKHKRT